mmetsp:Transcript_86480/g.280007  ORF Transcript_86480/g.280007 Transcript_86480/m.280007 type:complete len:274 (-) Transcript_86480:992-1813(-)
MIPMACARAPCLGGEAARGVMSSRSTAPSPMKLQRTSSAATRQVPVSCTSSRKATQANCSVAPPISCPSPSIRALKKLVEAKSCTILVPRRSWNSAVSSSCSEHMAHTKLSAWNRFSSLSSLCSMPGRAFSIQGPQALRSNAAFSWHFTRWKVAVQALAATSELVSRNSSGRSGRRALPKASRRPGVSSIARFHKEPTSCALANSTASTAELSERQVLLSWRRAFAKAAGRSSRSHNHSLVRTLKDKNMLKMALISLRVSPASSAASCIGGFA